MLQSLQPSQRIANNPTSSTVPSLCQHSPASSSGCRSDLLQPCLGADCVMERHHPPPRVHFQEAEYIENYEREVAIDIKYHNENNINQELTLDSQEQTTSDNQELALNRHYRASDKKPDDSESVWVLTLDSQEQTTSDSQELALNRHYRASDKRPDDSESIIEVTEDNEPITQPIRELPPQQGWSHQQPRYNTSNNRHHKQNTKQNRPNKRFGPYTNRIHNPNRPEMKQYNPNNHMSHNRKPTSFQHNPNTPDIRYGQDPKNTYCMYEPLPMGCRNIKCKFQHYNHHPSKGAKFNKSLEAGPNQY